jgi:hypothetical protein
MFMPDDQTRQSGKGLEALFEGASKGLVLPHDLDGAFDREALRDRVSAYVRWVETRLTPACPAIFLTAATIDPEGLKRLLQQVVRGIFEITPPQYTQPAVGGDTARTDRENKTLRVSRVLNGFLLLDEIVLGGWRRGVRRTGHTAALMAGRIKPPTLSQDDRAQFVDSASPGTQEKAMDAFRRLLTPHARRRQGKNKQLCTPAAFEDLGGTTLARHQSLYDGLLLAVGALQEILSEDLLLPKAAKDDAARQQAAHVEFVRLAEPLVEAVEQHEFTMRLDDLLGAVESLRVATEKWATESLVQQTRGHGVNQRKTKMLRRHVAYVCQYAWLLFGNRYADDLIDAAIQLRWLGNSLLAELKHFAGVQQDKPQTPPRALLREYDAIAMRPDLVPRWRNMLGAKSLLVGEFCSRMEGKQELSWLNQDQLNVFEEAQRVTDVARRGRRKPESLTLRRRQEAFAEDLLIPMQAVGLAAQAPWDYLWEHASDRKVPLKTYDAKKWVVNPLGSHLADERAT